MAERLDAAHAFSDNVTFHYQGGKRDVWKSCVQAVDKYLERVIEGSVISASIEWYSPTRSIHDWQ